MEKSVIDPTEILGWGIDADPKNDPTYPIKRRTNAEQRGYRWERPPQQPPTVEILHSNERPNLTAVVGTSTPPRGLSGVLRRLAFRYSESHYGHWLPLMLADRVGMVEGVATDLSHGHVPNIYAEMGGNAEWKYNRSKMVRRVLLGAVLTSVAVIYLRRRKQRS